MIVHWIPQTRRLAIDSALVIENVRTRNLPVATHTFVVRFVSFALKQAQRLFVVVLLVPLQYYLLRLHTLVVLSVNQRTKQLLLLLQRSIKHHAVVRTMSCTYQVCCSSWEKWWWWWPCQPSWHSHNVRFSSSSTSTSTSTTTTTTINT